MNDFVQFFSDSNPTNVSTSIKMLLLLTVLSLAPAILILMTSFARIVIVLSFVRTALATQQMPPNQVIVGLALFLTFFIMAPTFQEVNETALTPLFAEEITLDEAYERGKHAIQGIHEQTYAAKGFGIVPYDTIKQIGRNIGRHPVDDVSPGFCIK